MGRYRELAEERKQLIIDIKPFIGSFGNLLKPLPSFTQKELNNKIKRIEEIDRLLKKVDKALGSYSTPSGNYEPSINNFDY